LNAGIHFILKSSSGLDILRTGLPDSEIKTSKFKVKKKFCFCKFKKNIFLRYRGTEEVKPEDGDEKN